MGKRRALRPVLGCREKEESPRAGSLYRTSGARRLGIGTRLDVDYSPPPAPGASRLADAWCSPAPSSGGSRDRFATGQGFAAGQVIRPSLGGRVLNERRSYNFASPSDKLRTLSDLALDGFLLRVGDDADLYVTNIT